ncbi:MAG TPA: PadR family transcriptional regulator [Steroidobacteraceae bacterium]|nr:PadR family transcriptional regulator [Steroidobacteraceae bacterium]
MKAQLLVLGALHRGAMHPYEIRRRLKAALVECYTDVDVGTLYYCVRQLASAGEIEVHGTEKVARGGERTIYRITRSGRARLRALLVEQFAATGTTASSLYSALLFLHLADLPAVAAALRERLARQESALQETRSIRKRIGKYAGTGVGHLLDHLAAQRELDRRWLRRVLKDVEARKVRDSDLARLHSNLPRSAGRASRRKR